MRARTKELLKELEEEASEKKEEDETPQGIWRDSNLALEDDAKCPLEEFFSREEEAEMFYVAVKGDVKAFKSLVADQGYACLLPRPSLPQEALPPKVRSWGLREFVHFACLRAENEFMDEDLAQRLCRVLDVIDEWEDRTVIETVRDCENCVWSQQEVRQFKNVSTGLCGTTSVDENTLAQVGFWKVVTGEFYSAAEVRKVLSKDVLDPFRICWDNGLHFRPACELWPLRMYSLASVKMADESLDAETRKEIFSLLRSYEYQCVLDAVDGFSTFTRREQKTLNELTTFSVGGA